MAEESSRAIWCVPWTSMVSPLLPDWSSRPIPLHVVYPPNRHLSNKVRVFVDWVAELFANHDLIQRKSTFPRQGASRPPTV